MWLRGLDAGHARHVHVEEADVGLLLLELLDRLAAIARLRDDFELGPRLREQALERVAQQRLVVGDQCGRACRRVTAAACRAGNSSSAQTPCGSTSVRRKLRVAAERELQALAQRREPGAQAHCRLALQPDTRVGHAHEAAAVAHAHVDVDASALLARIDAVAHGVLDERQQRHRRALRARSPPASTSQRELQGDPACASA